MTFYDLVTEEGMGVGHVCAYSDEEAMTLAEQRGFTAYRVIEPRDFSAPHILVVG